MARRTGDRDRDHAAKRAALLDKIGVHLVGTLPRKPSLRELAAAAAVTIPTLSHYFGTRDDVIAAAMERQGALGQPYLAIVAMANEPFEASIRSVVRFILSGLMDAGVIDLHAVGLSEGMGSQMTGQTYLAHLLEPTLQALEARLVHHAANGEMRDCDTRIASLTLLSPLYVAALHQRSLQGANVRTLDMNQLSNELADVFVRAYRAL